MLPVQDDRPARGRHRLAAALALFVLASLPCGPALRAPAQPPAERPAAGRPPLDVSLVPPLDSPGFLGFYSVRVGDLFAAPPLAAHADEVNAFLAGKLKGTALPFNLPVRVQDVGQLAGRISFTITGKAPLAASSLLTMTALRMTKPCDWAGIVRKELPGIREVKQDGETYFEADWKLSQRVQPPGAPALPLRAYVADDRSIVLEAGDTVKELIAARKKPVRPEWADDWKEVADDLLAVVFHDPDHRFADQLARVPASPRATLEEKEVAELEERIARAASRLVVGVDTRDGLRVRARFTCERPEQAADLEKACAALAPLLRAAAGRDAGQAATPADKAAEVERALLTAPAIRRDGRQVVVTVLARGYGTEALVTFLGLTGEPGQAPAAPAPPPTPWAPRPR
jgi:hypothetical protein